MKRTISLFSLITLIVSLIATAAFAGGKPGPQNPLKVDLVVGIYQPRDTPEGTYEVKRLQILQSENQNGPTGSFRTIRGPKGYDIESVSSDGSEIVVTASRCLDPTKCLCDFGTWRKPINGSQWARWQGGTWAVSPHIAPDGSLLLNIGGSIYQINTPMGELTQIDGQVPGTHGDFTVSADGQVTFLASYPGSGGQQMATVDLEGNVLKILPARAGTYYGPVTYGNSVTLLYSSWTESSWPPTLYYSNPLFGYGVPYQFNYFPEKNAGQITAACWIEDGIALAQMRYDPVLGLVSDVFTFFKGVEITKHTVSGIVNSLSEVTPVSEQ